MAKWGEGDPRWIVEERQDSHNVNNWHWKEVGKSSEQSGIHHSVRGSLRNLRNGLKNYIQMQILQKQKFVHGF